ANEREAITAAFRDLRSGDLLVIGVEAIDEALACVQAHLDGTHVPTASRTTASEAAITAS
ncbi:MAG TPA: hypothetical protein VKD72_33365, partial [Gemmataceae bacterium]|nr:hypothetical protein [Gemmataceae bacterium]